MAPAYKTVPIVPRLRGEIIVHCVVTLIVLVVVTLRLVGRVRGIGLGWDDGLIVVGTVCACCDSHCSKSHVAYFGLQLMSITLLAMEGVCT
jgi:hypothetical protein